MVCSVVCYAHLLGLLCLNCFVGCLGCCFDDIIYAALTGLLLTMMLCICVVNFVLMGYGCGVWVLWVVYEFAVVRRVCLLLGC